MSTTPLAEREPIRLYALVAAALTSAGTCLVSIGQGVNALVAIGTALVGFGTIAGGVELARAKAWSPASVDERVDAHAVIDDLEQR